MAQSGNPTGENTLAPDEAFSVLGNETRTRILQVLGEADGPLSFTQLRDRVGIRQGAQFNYHLEKVVGHFVGKTEEGYALREPGRRVVQAILSGAVTEDPEMEPTEVDFPCRHCGAPVEVGYSRGKVRTSCRECGGTFEQSRYPPNREWAGSEEYGNLFNLSLPPAAVQGRSPTGVFRTAGTVAHLEGLAAASDVCPRCAAPVDQTITSVCEDHDATDGLCDRCDHRNAVRVRFRCTNCIYDRVDTAMMTLLDVPEVLEFAGEHGFNTTADGIEWGWAYGEEIHSTDPFEARFTITLDGDALVLTVDDDLSVVDVSRHEATESE